MFNDYDFECVGWFFDVLYVSLRDDYEVSVFEVEVIVRWLKDHGVVGVCMVGGGFGGFVFALLGLGIVLFVGGIVVMLGFLVALV